MCELPARPPACSNAALPHPHAAAHSHAARFCFLLRAFLAFFLSRPVSSSSASSSASRSASACVRAIRRRQLQSALPRGQSRWHMHTACIHFLPAHWPTFIVAATTRLAFLAVVVEARLLPLRLLQKLLHLVCR